MHDTSPIPNLTHEIFWEESIEEDNELEDLSGADKFSLLTVALPAIERLAL